jgi:hypothetical protein
VTLSPLALRRIGVVAVYALVLIGGGYLGTFLMQVSDIDIRPINEPAVHRMIMASAVAFATASAMPFVPGAEIGLAMIFILGGKIAPLVYFCMVFALSASFLTGLLVPARRTAAFFGFLGLTRARDLVIRLDDLAPADRLAALFADAPGRFVPFMLRHRYLALIVLINVPGNSLIGGGGGIAFAAGLSGLFGFQRYLAAVALAVLPVPAAYFFLG